jgi:hypothetical protein
VTLLFGLFTLIFGCIPFLLKRGGCAPTP